MRSANHPIIVFVLTCIVLTTPAVADTIRVPGDFPTIQRGLDAARDGDTVVVADGIYRGSGNRDLNFNGKEITLRSENGPSNCTIDCEGSPNSPHRAFYFDSGETAASVVRGFTITNGLSDKASTGGPFGGAIICLNGSSPTIMQCVLEGNTSEFIGTCTPGPNAEPPDDQPGRSLLADGSGGAVAGWYSRPTLLNCVIRNNCSDDWGGGVFFWSSPGAIINCVITGNVTRNGGGGVALNGGSDAVLINCTVADNVDHGFGGILLGPPAP